MKSIRTIQWNWRHLGVALLIVAGASMLRAVFFGGLGRGIPYLTYYPAVMLAALFGGLLSGFLATVVSASLCFFWIQRGTMSSVETLAITVFFISCTMISFICEATRRAQSRARQAQEKAETANRSKSIFLANMSHELRTPLNAILGFSGMSLNDTATPPRIRTTLDIINRSGNHLLNLINDVLDMAKVESGRINLEETAFDLQILVKDIIELMSLRAEAKGLALIVDLPAELPCTIVADESKLRQVLLNLIGNAVKFTQQGSVTLHLVSRQLEQPDNFMLIIEVIDTGPGIAAENRQSIFEPFVQLNHAADQKGTGLGLAIARQFVEVMGGTVTVESAIGKGSKFRVEVPVKRSETVVAAGNVGNELRRLAPGQQEYRVLIVDDQEENRLLLHELLEQAGFLVNDAVNGKQGVEVFQSWQPHTILMDWRMPVMNGLEATRRIRSLKGGRDVKIVAVTASVFNDEREKLLAEGADDVVVKPIQFKRIFDCLTKHLGVQFISDNSFSPSETGLPATAIDLKALASVPSPLRTELADAIVSTDIEQITEIIGRIAKVIPIAGNVLEHLARQFSYTVILRSLQKCSSAPLHKDTAV